MLDWPNLYKKNFLLKTLLLITQYKCGVPVVSEKRKQLFEGY